jgi:hypothetical protein
MHYKAGSIKARLSLGLPVKLAGGLPHISSQALRTGAGMGLGALGGAALSESDNRTTGALGGAALGGLMGHLSGTKMTGTSRPKVRGDLLDMASSMPKQEPLVTPPPAAEAAVAKASPTIPPQYDPAQVAQEIGKPVNPAVAKAVAEIKDPAMEEYMAEARKAMAEYQANKAQMTGLPGMRGL